MTELRTHLGLAPAIDNRALRRGHFGVWRAVTSLPAMVGSLLLLLVLYGWMGRWDGLLMLGWLLSGVAVSSRAGERAAVLLGCGFRRPSRAQSTALETVWSAALTHAGVAVSDVDLYVQCSDALNAYAVGGRSVAVTTGVLREFLVRRLGSDEFHAVLVHELGHHATRGTRFALVTMWLTTPWRVAARLVFGAALAAFGRWQPIRLFGPVAITGAVVAVVQAVQRGQVATAFVLSTVSMCAVVCPLANAFVSRRSEFAADGFAAGCGVAAPLSAALTLMNTGQAHRASWTERALSRHPSVSRRVEELDRYAAARTRT